jgi:3-dehydroquinate synthase
VPGGEFSKNIGSVLDDLLSHIHDARLCRHSTVLAIGGGAVLDVAGYAAAVAHRGVRLVRMPTTTLAQCDSGVGVKNGVNAFGQKNFVGTFSVPQAVVNDTRFLTTLSDRDWRAGFSEVVKVALLKDAELFAAITIGAEAVRRRDMEKSLPLLRRSAELHWRHIMECGDPFELTSARPLDYGHWSAHRLERLTDFALRHGEAVAIGVALDTVISSLEGRLTSEDCERTLSCLEALGFTLWHDALGDTGSLLEGLEEFREHLGGRLSITHLDAIGHSVTVDAINPQHVSAAVERLRLRHGREDVISQAI